MDFDQISEIWRMNNTRIKIAIKQNTTIHVNFERNQR